MKNEEIEIKIKLTKNDFQNLEKNLENKAEFVGEFMQEEQYFQPIGEKYIEPDGSIYRWLRLRTVNGKSKLTHKHVSRNIGKGRSTIEYETSVSDSDQTRKIIHAMGFENVLKFTKKRKVYKYKEKFEIALDQTENLGYFVEIEYHSDAGDIQGANKMIEKVSNELGLDLEDESLLGYAHLNMIEKGAKVPDFAKENYRKVQMNKKFEG